MYKRASRFKSRPTQQMHRRKHNIRNANSKLREQDAGYVKVCHNCKIVVHEMSNDCPECGKRVVAVNGYKYFGPDEFREFIKTIGMDDMGYNWIR